MKKEKRIEKRKKERRVKKNRGVLYDAVVYGGGFLSDRIATGADFAIN